ARCWKLPRRRRASDPQPLRGPGYPTPSSPQEASMQASRLALPVIALGALLAGPRLAAPQEPERHTISGDDIAIYNLAGVMRVEGGSGPGVAVELTRGGRDAGKLRVETGPVRGRETLRVIYPDDAIVYHELDFDGNTTLDVADDGTFNDREGHRRIGAGHRVRISGSGRGLDAHADLRVALPAGKRVAVYLAVGRVFVSNVDGDLQVDVSAAQVTADPAKGLLRADIESLYVDTGSGDVTIEMPPQFGAHVDIGTGNGGIELRGVSIRTTRLEREHIVGEIGDGKGRVKIETGSGGITLQRHGQ